MKNTGALLKAKRESSNLSLSEVALATKINPKILAAIEAGNESALPARTILKGFVRSYAQFLKMDLDEVMRTYQEETAPAAPVATAAPAAAPAEPAKAEAASRRPVDPEGGSGMRTVAVVVIVLLIGLIIGVRELIEKYQRETVVENSTDLKVSPVPQPTETAQAPAETAEPEAQAQAQAQTPAPTPTPAPEQTPAPAPAAEEAPAVVAPVVTPPPPIVVAPPVVAPTTPAPAPTPAPEPAPAPQAAQPTPPVEVKPAPETKAAKHEIILEALDKVEVKFQVKGETKRVSLAPTQVHTIHADQPLTIDLSDGGAVNVILDGRERGVPGDLGKPKTIKIP